MRKVVCFALLALSALAADTGARHELFPVFSNVDTSGFAVAWTSPGQVGLRVRIDGLESEQYSLRLVSAETVLGTLVGFFETNGQGFGVRGGFVAVDPAWDADGDGVIRVQIFVEPNDGSFALRSDVPVRPK